MVDLQTASYVAGLVGIAVNSIDKVYRGYADFFKKTDPELHTPPPAIAIQNNKAEGAIVSTLAHSGAVSQKVTYEELQSKLKPEDRNYIETLSKSLANYEMAWNSAYLERSMASGMNIGRSDAQLAYLAKEISDPLLKVLDFVETMGLYLDDHYLAARKIAKEYVAAGQS